MITLNGERGFEKIESWDDIAGLPGFKEELDPKDNQLKEIIGRYIFKDYISCGLSTCRQPHGKGYIVTTKSGQVTNIGNGCGKTHFGVEFKELSKVFERALTEHNNRETLATFMFQKEGNSKLLHALRSEPNGADWVYKTTKPLTQNGKGCPDTVISKINEIVRSRNGTLIKAREASEDEIKDIEAIEERKLERPHYIGEVKGTLNGIEALFPENNLRKIIIKDLEDNLKTLSDIDIDNATYKELQYWVKWTAEFDNKIVTIKRIISSGVRLLDADNLLQLLHFVNNAQESKEYKKWIAGNIKL